jgi:transcriptional regulator NrdR family protein
MGSVLEVSETTVIVRRRQYCARCGQVMFEFFYSPDGHFGLVDDVRRIVGDGGNHIRCPTCDARYRLLERLDPTGRPVARL